MSLFDVRLVGEAQLQQLLNDVDRAVQNPRPLFQGIAMELVSLTEENFAAEGNPKWPALSASTIAQRTKRGTWPGKILQVTAGGLAASITTEVGPNYARIGSTKPYAAIQQLGGQAGRRQTVTIPARPYMPFEGEPHAGSARLQPEAREAVLDLALDFLKRAARV